MVCADMISLGGLGSGLPWHTHGETWIAAVYGRKAWFVYPPGSARSSQRGSPLHDANTWLCGIRLRRVCKLAKGFQN